MVTSRFTFGGKKWRYALWALLKVSVLFAVGCSTNSQLPKKDYPTGSLEAALETIRYEHDLPGLAVAVIDGISIEASAAVGVRKLGAAAELTANDKFQLGSITKSMTATLAAKLVEQNKLSWTTTVADVFPELVGAVEPAFEQVTLEHLLSHRAGVVALTNPDETPELSKRLREKKGDPTEQRHYLVEEVLKLTPVAPPGTRFLYSNAGYVVAGAMLETVTDTPWETLLQQELFTPLGLSSAGFGTPATPGQLDAPWGHYRGSSRIIPIAPDAKVNNTPMTAPADAIHLSLLDFASYAALHLQAYRGDDAFLSELSRQALYVPRSENGYALGFIVEETPAGRGVFHDGSNGSFYVWMWLFPDANKALVIGTNLFGAEIERPMVETMQMLVERYAIGTR